MTLDEAQQHLQAWLNADLALANAKSYQLVTPSGSRTVTRADAQEIQNQIKYWQGQVSLFTSSKSKISRYSLASFNG